MVFRRSLSLAILIISLLGCEPSPQKEGLDESTSQDLTSELRGEQTPFDLEKQRKSFGLTGFKVLDISESEYDKTPALAISFSVPLNASNDLNQFVRVTDKNGQLVDGGWILNQSRTRLYFTNTQPNTRYKIEVNKNITSITDRQLPKKSSATVNTANLENSVRFMNKGSILPSDLTRGLAVESVNIKEVDINFHRVNREKIAQVVGNRLNGYSYYVREIPQYSKLVFSARYQLDYAKNKRLTTNLPLHQLQELKEPGLYIAVMKPAGEYPYEHQVTSFYISNLALHTRSFDKAVEIHALSIMEGKSQAGVSLEALSRKGKTLAKAMTDQSGNHRMVRWEEDTVLLANKGDDFAVIALNAPALDLSDQLQQTRKQNTNEVFLYGPRNLYRPGETVSINGLLRGGDGEKVASVPLQVNLIRPDSRIAKEFTWHPSEQEGFYTRNFLIGKSEPTGEWIFRVIHPSKANFEYKFSVEEFLPETMKLALESSVEGLLQKHDTLKISGQGDYLYGAPAAGNRIAAKVKVQPSHYPVETLKDFYFGVYQKQSSIQETELQDKKLNADGHVEWTLPNLWKNFEVPTQVIFEASLFESGGRPVTRHLRKLVWPGKNQIGLRKAFSEQLAKPFQDAMFEIVNTDQNGELSAVGQMEISLIREDRRYYWRNNHRGWDYSQNQSEKKVFTRVISNAEKQAQISVPVEYGTYRIEIRDDSGKLRNSYQFFAGWSWDEHGDGAVAGARPDKIRLLFDKESYQAGDVAKVKLLSPYLGNTLIRIEGDAILWEKQTDLSQLESEISIPISADWNRHDLYVTSLVVSQRETGGLIKQLPKRALGIAPMRLDRSDREISLKLNAPELTNPEQTVVVEIIQQDKLAAEAFVTLAAVDTGVLSLSNYKTPNALNWFYGQRAYSAEMRDSFSQLIKNRDGELAHLKFGGDAELVRGGEQPATDVQIVSLFSNLVKFDTKGKALVELNLPRFNGELRLMALAFSGNKFGHEEQLMTVRAPIVAEISKPRFLATGDKSQFGFDLQNMSGKEQKFIASFNISGALKATKTELPIELEDGEKFSTLIDINASGVGDGKISLSLFDESKSPTLTRDWLLGVRSAYPAEFKRLRKVLQQGESFTFGQQWIEEFSPVAFQASIEYSSVPPLNTESHMQQLFQYPYGCLEQTSSRAWPLLLHTTSADGSNEKTALDERVLKVLSEKGKHIDAAIQRISGMQRGDGGFGLWNNRSEENHWLTVYALEFLLTAMDSGYAVPSSVISKATERLKWYSKSLRISYSERTHYAEDPNHYALAFRAYSAYILSKLNQINLSQLRQLSNKFKSNARSGLPLAHLAAAFENLGDEKTARSLWSEAIQFKNYQLRYSGDYGSQVRDLAWIMRLASESKLKLSYQDLIYFINDELLSKRWFSTQERFALYHLAKKLEEIESGPWKLKVASANGEDVRELEQIKRFRQKVSAESLAVGQMVTLLEGESLFMDLQVVAYPKSTPEPVADGISVSRKYYDLNGKVRPLNTIKAGDYVLVRLDVTASERMPDALLVDLIPAGFELENPGLEYAMDYSQIMIDGDTVARWMKASNFKHQEYRDDRYVAALSLEQRRWSTLFYVMRAVTAGTYLVPPTQVEDMYRPQLRALGEKTKPVKVLAR